ncbi:MAG: hypothetical protein JO189_11565, partial [Deltaproteobacteria bacterium]|nr:hypothetical protein [Deltaproteobacteria bacterium]
RTHGALPCTAITDRTTGDGAAILSALESQGRVCRVSLGRADAPEVAIVDEDLASFSAAYVDLCDFRHRSAESQTTSALPFLSPRGAAGASPFESPVEIPDYAAAVEEIVRRAMVTSGPILPVYLAERLSLPVEDILPALIALEAKGYVFRGHFTAAPNCVDNSGYRTQGMDVQWCDRHVLERVHRQTLNLLRSSIEPCSDAEFAAFRLKWNGIGDAHPPTGVDGVRRALEQMSGLTFAPDLWERAILPARVNDYRPEQLDLLCMSGEFAWMAAPFHDQSDMLREFPATVAFLPRKARCYWAPCEMPTDLRTQTVAEVLAQFGAQYLDQIAERANLSERDTLAALWRLAAAGLVSNDSFAPLRLLAAEPDAARLISSRQSTSPHLSRKGTLTSPLPQRSGRGTDRAGEGQANHEPSRRDAALRARLQSSLSGRWSLVPQFKSGAEPAKAAEAHDAHGSDDAREIALILLRRHGILAREMMALEQIEIPWQQILFALRRLEYAGTIRRGWFVRALSGEQYALPEALEILRAERQGNGTGQLAVIAAVDPANPFGALLPGCGIAREPGNLLVIQDGSVIAGLAGRALTNSPTLDQSAFTGAITELMKMRPRLVLETINSEPALESTHVSAMAAMGFHSDGRALVYDGLPGPRPRRAIASEAGPDQNY